VVAVIFCAIFERCPIGLPARLTQRSGATVELPTDDASVLQEVAARANEEYGLAAE
jgi:hypothetical protein